MILTPVPLGLDSASSSSVSVFPPAATMALAAASEKSYAATVIFLLMLPAARTFPGTTMVSPSCAYLSSLLRFASAQFLLGFSSLSAMSRQMAASVSLVFAFSLPTFR